MGIPINGTGLVAEEVALALGLERLPGEGGFYRRTWSSPLSIDGRSCGSAIYYLLAEGPEGFSAFHRLKTDEVYHFYRGDPVELHLFRKDGSYELIHLGPEFEKGQYPQALVPALSAQASRLVPGGRWALLGTTMAPAFVPEDFALLGREELCAAHPDRAALIEALTRG
jgi:uncharacterized protein